MEQIKTNSITIGEAKEYAIFVARKELCCNIYKARYLGGGSFGYVYKVDIDKSEDLSRKFGIMVVPTMIIFKDGKEQEKFSGYMQKEDILAKLNNFSKI